MFRAAGFEVDLVSETGSYQPDWLSQQKEWLKDEERKVWEDHGSEFRGGLDRLKTPGDVRWEEVSLVCGGRERVGGEVGEGERKRWKER